MNYPPHLRLLDLFGMFAGACAIAYLYLPEGARPEQRLDGLWGNISSELVGIWIGVRLIDWIIRANESRNKIRVRVVRGMRFIEKKLYDVVSFMNDYDIALIYRELEWLSDRHPDRVRYLSYDEIIDVNAFYSAVRETLSEARNQLSNNEEAPIDETAAVLRKHDLSSRYDKAVGARRVAESNILSETNEDDGL